MGLWKRMFGGPEVIARLRLNEEARMHNDPSPPDSARSGDVGAPPRLAENVQLLLHSDISHGDPEVRDAAARALAGSVSSENVQLLLHSDISHGDPEVRDAAAQALSGSRLSQNVQLLLHSDISHGHPDVRDAAARALRQ